MTCSEIRRRLLDTSGRGEQGALPTGRVAAHLPKCAACARFAISLRAAQDGLRDHHARVEPDAGFADRVLQRLPGGVSQTMGQAAMRLLPLSVALLLFLVWLTSQTEPTRSSVVWSENNEEAYMSWILQTAAAEGP